MDGRTQSEQEHAQHAVEEVKTAARQAGEHLQSSATEMAEAGKQTARRFSAAWGTTKQNIQEKAVASAKATDRIVRDYPYATVGVAFGLGVLLGMLINRE